MENVLSLSIEEQNNFNESILDAIVSDSKRYAGENVADYLIEDFKQSPESWDCMFEYAYDEVSSKAKQGRIEIIKNLLVMRGYIPNNY
jgi:hypothetical protein